MRISLFVPFISISIVQNACGDVTERRHIDEATFKQENIVLASSPLHSPNGWQTTVRFHVQATSPDHIIEASIAAAASWNDALGYSIIAFDGVLETERGSDLYASLDDNDTVVYYEKNWLATTGKPATTLATTVWENDRRSDRIVRGDVILNSEIYLFQDSTEAATDETRKNYIVDAETVLLHEFGHLLGLDHVSENDDLESVMHAKTFIGPHMHSRILSGGDRSNIRSIYD